MAKLNITTYKVTSVSEITGVRDLGEKTLDKVIEENIGKHNDEMKVIERMVIDTVGIYGDLHIQMVDKHNDILDNYFLDKVKSQDH